MSGFACAPSIVPPPAPVADAIVANDGWFPDIDLVQLRGAMRIRDSVTPERFRHAVIAAMGSVSSNLSGWQADRLAAGYSCLDAVPAAIINNESRLAFLYRRAVATTAKAELVENYRDVDLTAAGQRRVEDLEPSIAELRRDAIHAIRDILGVGRTCVELI